MVIVTTFDRPEDYYLRAAANIAFQGKRCQKQVSEDIIAGGVEPLMEPLTTYLKRGEVGPGSPLHLTWGPF